MVQRKRTCADDPYPHEAQRQAKHKAQHRRRGLKFAEEAKYGQPCIVPHEELVLALKPGVFFFWKFVLA